MTATRNRAATTERPAPAVGAQSDAPLTDADLRAWHRRVAALKSAPVDPAVDPVLVAEKARRGMRP